MQEKVLVVDTPGANLSAFKQIVEIGRAMVRKAKNLPDAAEVLLPGDTERGRYVAVAMNKYGQLSMGRAAFKGKRRNPHWNKTLLTINSRAIHLTNQSLALLGAIRYAEGKEVSASDLHAVAVKSAEMAQKQIVNERHAAKKLRRQMRQASQAANKHTGNTRAVRIGHAGI